MVVTAGGFTADRVSRNHRLQQQRSDYAAGLDASHRADCARALPLLSDAAEGGSATVAAAARRERQLCDNLRQMQARTANQVPTAALISWIGYLSSGPPKPFQAVAVTASRTAVTSGPLDRIVTAPLCRQRLELAEYGILTVKHSDPLAADFIKTCVAAQAETDPGAAVRLYSTLRTEYPRTAAEPTALKALGRVVTGRLTPAGVKAGLRAVSTPRSLGGKTQFVVRNGRADITMEMLLTGAVTRKIDLKACKSCKRMSSSTQAWSQCNQRRADRRTLTLPAGKYNWALVDKDSLEDLWVEQWDLKPNRVYDYCWWTDVDGD